MASRSTRKAKAIQRIKISIKEHTKRGKISFKKGANKISKSY